MEVILMDTCSIVSSGKNSNHAGSASGTRFDVQIIRAQKLNFMSGLLTFEKYLFQQNFRIGHLPSKGKC
jgi:hypothetical protein